MTWVMFGQTGGGNGAIYESQATVTASSLTKHDPCHELDATAAIRVNRASSNASNAHAVVGARQHCAGTVHAVRSTTEQISSGIIGMVVPVAVVHIPVTIVINAVVTNLTLISPELIANVRVVDLRSSIDHLHDEGFIRSNRVTIHVFPGFFQSNVRITRLCVVVRVIRYAVIIVEELRLGFHLSHGHTRRRPQRRQSRTHTRRTRCGRRDASRSTRARRASALRPTPPARRSHRDLSKTCP